jgi:hypothetical protein
VADGVGDGAEDADGCGVHDQVGELKHGFGEALGKGKHGAALGFRDEDKRHGEEDAEDDDLKDLAFGDGLGNAFRKNVGDELCGGVRSDVERFGGGGKADAVAGAAEVDRGETDEHGEGGDEFEIDEGFEREAADFFEVGVAGDADDESAEEKRGDDDFDEAEKDRAEELKIDGEGGEVVAEFRAGEETHKDPAGERAAGSSVNSDEEDGEPAQDGDEKRGERQKMRAGENSGCDRQSGDEKNGEEEAVFHWQANEGSMEGENMMLRPRCQDSAA